MRIFVCTAVVLLELIHHAVSAAEPSEAALNSQPSTLNPRPSTERWEIGMTVEAPGACTGISATIPVPTDWPEQQVKLLDQQASPRTAKILYKTPADGVKQMVITIPRLPAGATANVLATFEVTKQPVSPPPQVQSLKKPGRPSADLRPYLGTSPGIETTDREIGRIAAQVVQGKATDWAKVEAIYEWVRENVQYQFDEELKGALVALKSGHGDCEELTSLFIALCRANDIPARSVWIPGHCYPEFYLEDAAGQGHWFPCQAAGSREFGSMHESRPILQKGDKFSLQTGRPPVRYVAEVFSAKDAAANPRVQWVRRKVEN
jgi:hypothetical protein